MSLGLAKDNEDALVTRGPKSFLECGSQRITGAAAIDQHLEKFVGLPPELLATLTYRAQKSPGLFLSRDDADKKSFLSLILGLTPLEDEIEKAGERVKELDKSLLVAQTKYEGKISSLKDLQDRRPSSDMVDVSSLFAIETTYQQETTLARENHAAAKTELQNHIGTTDIVVAGLTKQAEKDVVTIRKDLADLEANRPVYVEDETESKRLSDTLAEVMRRLDRAWNTDKTNKAAITSKLDTLKRDLYRREREGATLPGLQDKITRLKREQTGSNCPKCNQPWVKSVTDFNAFNTEIEVIQAEIDRIADEYLEVSMIKGEIAALTAKLGESDPIIAQLQKIRDTVAAQAQEELSRRKIARIGFYADYDKKYAAMEATIATTRASYLQRIDNTRNKARATEDALRVVADAALQTVRQYERLLVDTQNSIDNGRKQNNAVVDAIHAHEAAIVAAETAANGALGDVEVVKAEIAAERDFVKLVGREGFLGNIFGEVLLEIAAESNKILKNVPNVAHVTVKFKNETTTGKGSVKKKITPVVSIAGVERPLGAALSGGMRTVVDLAVDLATRRIVTRRSASNPAWMILDECMEGLSNVEKECIMHILKQFAEDTLILVVDHATEFKELFDKVIEVKNVHGKSSV